MMDEEKREKIIGKICEFATKPKFSQLEENELEENLAKLAGSNDDAAVKNLAEVIKRTNDGAIVEKVLLLLMDIHACDEVREEIALKGVRHQNFFVAENAIALLGELRSQRGVTSIAIRMMELGIFSVHTEMAINSIDALAKIGGEEAGKLLLNWLRQSRFEHGYLSCELIRAIGKAGYAQGGDTLRCYIELQTWRSTFNEEEIACIIDALGDLRNKRAEEAILPFTLCGDEGLERAAKKALILIHGLGPVEIMQMLDRNEILREDAVELVGKIGKFLSTDSGEVNPTRRPEDMESVRTTVRNLSLMGSAQRAIVLR